jgi:hypothetical protein
MTESNQMIDSDSHQTALHVYVVFSSLSLLRVFTCCVFVYVGHNFCQCPIHKS